MSISALLLVLVAAVLHATWNYCAKRAGGGLPFVFLVGLVMNAAYVPALAVFISIYGIDLTWSEAGWIVGSGVLKTGYSLFLQRGYRTGDFSLV
ncbi:hypothetical protein ASA1KI_34210 [Opitutales bacterium ASA1]|uniref:hypothetical protein n=1 Tax=Congregicoccus parvus TaxID=3081749 RepID=UPI002B2858F4|nr:hypothetical protein ASA1KI_34210 [Opitutales bacterium ASA1]